MFSIDLLKWLGDRRDGLLVVIAAVYGLGYLVWSYTAWLNGLGRLPALEFQYLVAGLIPGAIIALAYVVYTHLQVLQDFLGSYKHRERLSTVLIDILIVIAVYALLEVMFLALRRFSHIDHKWLPILPPIPNTVISLIPLIFSPAIMFLENRVPRGILWPIYRILIALAVANLSFAYYMKIYYGLPQAMGGPAPRCAYIDLVRSKMSSSSFRALSSSQSQKNHDHENQYAIRSARLFVYFSGNDYLLVRIDTNSTESLELKRAPLYELRKTAIQVIEWCADEDTPRERKDYSPENGGRKYTD